MCHMCHTQTLDLRFNQIGDQGVTALAEACAGGALPALETLFLDDNPASEAAQQGAMDAIDNRN